MKNLILGILAMMLLFFSCVDQSIQTRNRLLVAASLMESNADSALFLLQNMPVPDEKDTAEYTPYLLLLKQAQSKNQVKMELDSLMKKVFDEIYQRDQKSAVNYLMDIRESESLSMKAVANKYLADMERAAGNYEKAFDYTDIYLQLKDSVAGIHLADAQEEIRNKYNIEKLAKDTNLLKIAKIKEQKIYILLICTCIFIFLLFCWIYQKRLQKKEKELLRNKQLVQIYKAKIRENEMIIAENLILLDKKELELIENRELERENQRLQEQNHELEEQIEEKEREYNDFLEKHKKEYLNDHKELNEKFEYLKRRKEVLMDQIMKKNPLLSRLRNCVEKKTKFSQEELDKIVDTINELYDGLIDRLRTTYPVLTPEEILLCSLLKIRLKTNQIAMATNNTTDNIYKRKQRIKEKLGLQGTRGLEDFLCELEYV